MTRTPPPASIVVLAGTNGAGKSSVAGAAVRANGGDYFNPDEATGLLLRANAGLSLDEANSRAWTIGRDQLVAAIAARRDYTFETTLGANTYTRLLAQASDNGLAVRMWYVALESPDLHIQRVRARVAAGGHDIPEEKIRQRYVSSIQNLIRLLPKLTELHLYDNSAEGNPREGIPPRPLLILSVLDGRITHLLDLSLIPTWAKPVVMAALRSFRI
ncbi:MAG TPA: AAA family ATPase [Longimicrobiaceae bacterium]|nr:AAA family ATPase [Longimicrobiaceae bacterium]